MSNTTQIIANRLRERRMAVGIETQIMAAEVLGIPRSRYKNYEIALRTPDFDLLKKAGELFHTNPAYLCGWTDDPTPQH